ncbi:MAG TPA: UDP-N-acetylmuramoyl-tripeptide--D-alanyl-D-alanine ligase [Erysipelothrix sp.]|nr:UDP-N-acetylmuramoyl-tripeptide--D-alanyl-D-alanine ligase [Erysipelothrix sp.]
MKKMTVREIGKLLGKEVIGNATVMGVNVDSRSVNPGDLFVCLIGERVDGHDFAVKAIENGATALMVSRKLDLDIPQVLVSDTLKGLFSFAKLYRRTLNFEAIGITGSNGKTSTKDILNSVLSRLGHTVATHSNQNTDIGSCLTLFRADEKTQYGIFEMGLDAPGEIDRMVDIIKPTSAIITGLDEAHIDNFNHDLKVLAKEKFSIFSKIENQARCFYQGDIQEYRDLAADHQSFGFNDTNDFVISDVVVEKDTCQFKLNNRKYKTNLLGKHQASNAGGATALLRDLGVNDRYINEGLMHVSLTKMRTEIYQHHKATILFDAYKASPKSMISALELFETYPSDQKRVVVLADMYMLGENSEFHHEAVLSRLKTMSYEHLFLLGDEFKKALHKVTLENVTHFDSIEALKQTLQPYYEQPVFILFKGSRYYELEKLMKED